MKLIIERTKYGYVYITKETEKKFKINEENRKLYSKRVELNNMDSFGSVNSLEYNTYIVLDLKK